MTHTTNFNLSQWAKSDRIQMADFNADNAKIDAALAAVSQCNCRCYAAGYTGDGETSRTFTFPGKPMFLAIVSDSSYTVLNRGLNKSATIWSTAKFYEFSAAWGDTSVTLTCESAPLSIANNPGRAYGLFAILEVG